MADDSVGRFHQWPMGILCGWNFRRVRIVMPLSIETYSLRKLIAHLLVVMLILSKRYS